MNEEVRATIAIGDTTIEMSVVNAIAMELAIRRSLRARKDLLMSIGNPGEPPVRIFPVRDSTPVVVTASIPLEEVRAIRQSDAYTAALQIFEFMTNLGFIEYGYTEEMLESLIPEPIDEPDVIASANADPEVTFVED